MSPPFLSACPKYASKSYCSSASHILSFCFISVSGFIENISLTVFLGIEQTLNCMANNRREITPKIHEQEL